ncbi:MAG: penicillin-binding transpeptidase domain-containing protein [Verrucomicrobiota bacterium]
MLETPNCRLPEAASSRIDRFALSRMIAGVCFGAAWFFGLSVGAVTSAEEQFVAPNRSDSQYRTHIFTVPAPRGTICDRNGEVLAHSVVASRCALKLLAFENPDNVEAVIVQAQSLACELQSQFPAISVPDQEDVRRHWEYRRWVPMPISPVLPKDQVEGLASLIEETPQLISQAVYSRTYPHGSPLAHLLGYVSRTRPDQFGPMAASEHIWSPFDGQMGMEKALDDVLRGEDGKLSMLYDDRGELIEQVLESRPQLGKTVVTTFSLEMQKLAMEALKESGRPGALVAVDAYSGDILAAASYPTFDPNAFVPPNSPVEFYGENWDSLPNAPFFCRAIDGAYPPGSTFKPLVALAAMHSGTVRGTLTRYSGPPSLDVDGRVFRNWNSAHEGRLDVRFALLRSCNTWFYQAAIETGGDPLIKVAKAFGLGVQPPLPLPLSSGAAGNVPSGYLVNRAIANFSIGQGSLLVSPLQMAQAMAGLANGEFVPNMRMVLQYQDPISGEIVEDKKAERFQTLDYSQRDLELVRQGMWGVVNHPAGTGERAALRYPDVYGKTGTSQWFVDGIERRLAWFTGFVSSRNPNVAFAVLTQGKEGESLSGGRNAAPIARRFLGGIYANPQKYGVERPSKGRLAAPLNDTIYISTPRTIATRNSEEVRQANEALKPDRKKRSVAVSSYTPKVSTPKVPTIVSAPTRQSRPVIRARIIKNGRFRTRR